MAHKTCNRGYFKQTAVKSLAEAEPITQSEKSMDKGVLQTRSRDDFDSLVGRAGDCSVVNSWVYVQARKYCYP